MRCCRSLVNKCVTAIGPTSQRIKLILLTQILSELDIGRPIIIIITRGLSVSTSTTGDYSEGHESVNYVIIIGV